MHDLLVRDKVGECLFIQLPVCKPDRAETISPLIGSPIYISDAVCIPCVKIKIFMDIIIVFYRLTHRNDNIVIRLMRFL